MVNVVESPKLGLKENLAQFSLLVVVNAFVGAMVGLERSILPSIAEQEFNLAAKSAIFSFIVVFGLTSDSLGRKQLIAWGMWVQAIGIAAIALTSSFVGFATGGVLLGVGTAMVYPTLLAAIGDVAHPTWRASAVGIYRLWRDSGYAVGAVVAGITADVFGLRAAVWVVAAVTFASGVIVILRMRETLKHQEGKDCMRLDELSGLNGASLIDVRSREEYDTGHVSGATNIPLDELIPRVAELSAHKTIVTICGKGGGRSEQAAEMLRAAGFENARSLCGGYQGWKAATRQP